VSVASATNLFDYFDDQVRRATRTRDLSLAGDTHLYLVNLLTERARADRPEPPEHTLAELHGRAAASPPAEQARTYRELGDRSLYLLGNFPEHVSRGVVGPRYYAAMGSAAYDRVDALLKLLFADAFGPVFRELAERFRDCVRVLSDVRDAHRRDRPGDLIVLYERWLGSGDPVLEARLREGGFVLPTGPSRDH
jgi:hypothetical protein